MSGVGVWEEGRGGREERVGGRGEKGGREGGRGREGESPLPQAELPGPVGLWALGPLGASCPQPQSEQQACLTVIPTAPASGLSPGAE